MIHVVLCQAIQNMVSDEKYWHFRLDEGYSSLVHRSETSPTCCMQIKCYASLIMITMFYGITLDPISPFLLASILQGDTLLYDNEFLNAMAPATSRLISHWPEDDMQFPLASNEIHLLLSKVNLEVFFIESSDGSCYINDSFFFKVSRHSLLYTCTAQEAQVARHSRSTYRIS